MFILSLIKEGGMIQSLFLCLFCSLKLWCLSGDLTEEAFEAIKSLHNAEFEKLHFELRVHAWMYQLFISWSDSFTVISSCMIFF